MEYKPFHSVTVSFLFTGEELQEICDYWMNLYVQRHISSLVSVKIYNTFGCTLDMSQPLGMQSRFKV